MGRDLLKEYMEAKFRYAGICAATRTEIIADMRSKGIEQRGIDIYLFGLDRNGPLTEEEAAGLLTFQECVEQGFFQ